MLLFVVMFCSYKFLECLQNFPPPEYGIFALVVIAGGQWEEVRWGERINKFCNKYFELGISSCFVLVGPLSRCERVRRAIYSFSPRERLHLICALQDPLLKY